VWRRERDATAVGGHSYGPRRPEPYVYPVAERPDAQVLVDGEWLPAELRMRTQRADGWHYNASWHRDGMTYLDTFPAASVRLAGPQEPRG
jgi:hypothetical protein